MIGLEQLIQDGFKFKSFKAPIATFNYMVLFNKLWETRITYVFVPITVRGITKATMLCDPIKDNKLHTAHFSLVYHFFQLGTLLVFLL